MNTTDRPGWRTTTAAAKAAADAGVRTPLAVLLLLAAATFATVQLSGPASAADGSSYVDPSVDYANLRSCPSLPNEGADDCGPVDQVPGGADVRMICWTVGNPPGVGLSAKWFWVEEGDGAAHPGDYRGYMWSDLVEAQTVVPYCGDVDPSVIGSYTGNATASPDTATNESTTTSVTSPQVSLAQGPAAPYGYRYAVSVSGYTPHSAVTIGCYDSLDSLTPFYTFDLFTDDAGNGYTESQCYSGDGPWHWVSVNGTDFSNTVEW